MEALIWTAVTAAALFAAWRLPAWRLGKVLRQPLPQAHCDILQANIPVYRHMAPELKQQLHRLVQQFLYQKKFVGCAGQEIDDEVRLTIAGQACMLLLNRHSRVYPGLETVLVYPSAFMVPRKQVDEAGVVTEARQDLLGESWGDGRVVLSWDHVLHGARHWNEGQNVVLHEFAHQLDSESGSNNGAPWLGDRARYRRWSEVLSRDFANLRVDALYRQQSVLDHYGASSPAEFFAVATEAFFAKPWDMAERHPQLFEEFHGYYRVDPREWQAPPEREPAHYHGDVHGGQGYGQWQ
ncbi:zinc-dependent peptidase [Massilia cavernae]|uniref:Zinc-dependent peptidase n=1 Tax=Massilia cavernae TaxID=2320864 RepID=A0A418Y4C5_9BURK|nr:M90 family metallopeptidase [Massilia cavernae]RJG20488.1 zinc-dependent peptidase [Massilia cavernae]